jgi:hypothetical protein
MAGWTNTSGYQKDLMRILAITKQDQESVSYQFYSQISPLTSFKNRKSSIFFLKTFLSLNFPLKFYKK